MKTMRAGRLNYVNHEFAVKDVPIPEPGPGQVRIKVEAAGVCLSDVHLIDGTISQSHPYLPPVEEVTLGHETAGVIEALGSGVTQWKIGDRVLLQAGQRCGMCDHCKNYELCLTPLTRGVDYDGGWAEYAVADAFTVEAIPDDLPFEQAAIIPDAVSTPWASIYVTGAVKACEAVGVWGVGGLGAHGVQLLRLVGAAPIIALDPSPAARQRALDFGADLALDPGQPDLADQIEKATGGRMLDAAFDFAGVPPVRTQARMLLRPKGHLVLVGLAPGDITIPQGVSFSYMQQQVRGHYGSQAIHVKQLIELARLHRLDFAKSISGVLSLEDAKTAVHQVETKEGDPIRLILHP